MTTVKELIEELKKYPEDMDVLSCHGEHDDYSYFHCDVGKVCVYRVDFGSGVVYFQPEYPSERWLKEPGVIEVTKITALGIS